MMPHPKTNPAVPPALAILAAILAAMTVTDARAERPMALVEDISAPIDGLAFMDYVEKGRVIPLAPGQTLVLSYLHSCVSETIRGGTVTVGVRESEVQGGSVERTKTPCDGGALLLSADESGKAGVTVMRDAGISLPGDKPRPQLTLRATRPVLVLSKPGLVTFERIDKPGSALSVSVGGGILDMAKGRERLQRGATYRVGDGVRTYVVKVADDATDKGGMAVGRLIRF